jgi:RimJ/RimL family protein N-acetyltransferase
MRIEPVTLSGNTVRLEPYRAADFDELADAALGAPEIFRFIPSRLSTREDFLQRYKDAERLLQEGRAIFFVTRQVTTGKLLGSTASYVTDSEHRRIEIGSTWLVPSAQRTAANTEAKYLQLGHAFGVPGAVRVEFKTDARNARSRAALQRLGAKEEGTLRSHMLCWDGHRRDSVYFSILDVEWAGVKARLESMLVR